MRRFWKGMNKVLDWIVILFCIFCVLVCMYALVDSALVYEQASGSNLLNYKPTLFKTDSGGGSGNRTLGVAWLTVDGTSIDYPIMQGVTNEEYLNKDPEGKYSLAGSLFLDSRNKADFTDPYSLIYGHHMAQKKMFGALDDFKDMDFLKSHTHGTLIVGQKVYDITLFAEMDTTADVSLIFQPNEGAGGQEAAEAAGAQGQSGAAGSEGTSGAAASEGRPGAGSESSSGTAEEPDSSGAAKTSDSEGAAGSEVLQYVKEHADNLLDNIPEGNLLGLSTCVDTDTKDRTLVFGILIDSGKSLADLQAEMQSETESEEAPSYVTPIERVFTDKKKGIRWPVLFIIIAFAIGFVIAHAKRKKRTAR